jgi:hypothetical protein
MPSGEFGTINSPQKLLGMLMQGAAQVLIGTQELYGSLEVTSDTYTNYNASIGMQNGKSIDFGELSELGSTINATVEPFDAINQRQPSIYIVTEEEATITTGLTQFDYRVLELLFHNGALYDLETATNEERLITFGGSCNIKFRPLSIGASNIACYLPTTQDVTLGITGIFVTFYQVFSTSGFNLDNISAKELNTMVVEWSATPVTTNALGNQQGNIYLF